MTAAGCINADLGKISAWASTWLVTFNPSKTETLLVSRKLNRLPHPPVFMQNHQISEVESHKHLGLYFSYDCTWHQHIKYNTDKAWNRINTMRKLKFRLDRKSLETIYTAFINPSLNTGTLYGIIVHYTRSKSLIKYRMRRLESPQEPPGSFLLLIFIRKSDETHSKKDEQITSLHCFTK